MTIPDPPASLVNWSQVAGAILSLLALVIALFAIWKSNRDIAAERQHQHDLEILREIGTYLNPRGDPWEAAVRIAMLRSNVDFPMARAALGLNTADEAKQEFERLYNDRKDALPRTVSDAVVPDTPETRWLFAGSVTHSDGQSILRRELNEAVRRRLAP